MIEFKILNSSSEDVEDFSFAFSRLLHEATQQGASMGYLLETPISQLENYWAGVLSNVARGSALVVYAEADSEIIGVVVLHNENNPNARHRAEVKKLIVRSDKRGQGIARNS